MNYLTMCGMLAGSMTDPPALAFANNLHPTSGAAALSYATVYPLVMFLRIITPNYWRCSSGVSVNSSPGGVAVNGTPRYSLAFLNITE